MEYEESRLGEFEPTTDSSWVKPVHAVVVVGLVGVAVVTVICVALYILVTTPGSPEGAPPLEDPNAATIAAIVTAGITALSSLAAAYFGIRVASESAAQATLTARRALAVTDRIAANSTSNGNPDEEDF